MEPSNIDQFINFIQGVGFPVFVATYLLVVVQRKLQENTDAISELLSFLRDQTLYK